MKGNLPMNVRRIITAKMAKDYMKASKRGKGPDLLVLEGGAGKLFLDLPSSGYVRVEAYDVVGRYLGEVYRGYFSGGRRDVKVDLSGLGSGVYFLRVEGPGIDEMRRVLLVR